MSENRIKVDPTRVKAINNLKSTNQHHRGWKILGIAGCYGCFIKGLDNNARPLMQLLLKESHFSWMLKQEMSSLDLKGKLTKAFVVIKLEKNEEYVFYIDVSKQGLRYV